MYECKILADSLSPEGFRLTTFQVTFPRFILAEFNTHRVLSRNSASSRAIPVKKSIEAIRNDPFIPEVFGKNQKGMSAEEVLDDFASLDSEAIWNTSIQDATFAAQRLDKIGVHKNLANRILEPYKWHTAIVTGTDWDNFFALRTAEDAQPEFRHIALCMEKAMQRHEPKELDYGEWHLPLLSEDEYADAWGAKRWPHWKMISIARCARVSYLTHDGKRDTSADIELYHRLRARNHLSPFEHVARPFSKREWHVADAVRLTLRIRAEGSGDTMTDDEQEFSEYLLRRVEYRANFHGWVQARSEIPNEDNASLLTTT